MRRFGWLLVAVIVLALWGWSQRATSPERAAGGSAPSAGRASSASDPESPSPHRAPRPRDAARDPSANDPRAADATPRAARRPSGEDADLPDEARQTLRLIARGGPYPHRRDGVTFQNRERRLPPRPRGYYREFTVETPGSRDRGARRIVTGGDPPGEYFYSDDHYRSFRRVDPGAAR